MLQQSFRFFGRRLGVLVALGHFAQAFETSGHTLDIGEKEFGFNGFDITHRINRTIHMCDVVVVKTAYNFKNSRTFPNGAEELIAESFAFACAPDQAGNVDKVDSRLDGFLWMNQFRERVKACIRHRHGRLVRFDGAERVIGRLGVLRLGQRIEKSGFAHIGQSDDADA